MSRLPDLTWSARTGGPRSGSVWAFPCAASQRSSRNRGARRARDLGELSWVMTTPPWTGDLAGGDGTGRRRGITGTNCGETVAVFWAFGRGVAFWLREGTAERARR